MMIIIITIISIITITIILLIILLIIIIMMIIIMIIIIIITIIIIIIAIAMGSRQRRCARCSNEDPARSGHSRGVASRREAQENLEGSRTAQENVGSPKKSWKALENQGEDGRTRESAGRYGNQRGVQTESCRKAEAFGDFLGGSWHEKLRLLVTRFSLPISAHPLESSSKGGAVGGGVQWIWVLSYNQLVYNIV